MQDTSKEIGQRYALLLGEERPFFTNRNYSINDFAAALGTNRSYASRFGKTELGVTFPV